ncbi:CPBP family intramembrane metalloprotease [Candidatus Gracilibacteria bacterium]|nr:CPBP family intramembrane metalloprotease [Candidatus Gracilibacteria bacterium]
MLTNPEPIEMFSGIDATEIITRKRWQPTNLDLALSLLVTFGLPFAAAWLFEITGGATASLVLYYAVCCVGLVWWRKGGLDYEWPQQWPWRLFLLSLILPVLNTTFNWIGMPRVNDPLLGVVVTALIWAPLNGVMEQLVWIYVLDTWRCRWTNGWQRWAGLAVGIVLIVTLVGLIHALFWGLFLPLNPTQPWGTLAIVSNTALTAAYVLLYDRSGSMWPTALLHTLVDLQLVLVPMYSIIGDL